jgi:hypothetical protein
MNGSEDSGYDEPRAAMTREQFDDFLKRVADLEKRYDEARKKLEKLSRSLALRFLWKDAFACGPVEACWSGTPDELKFTISRKDGWYKVFVPRDMDEDILALLNYPGKEKP